MNKFENSISKENEEKLEYTLDGDYRKYEMTCQNCQQTFKRSIPTNWFNGGDKIISKNLPENLNLENAKNTFENPNCGTCQR